VNYGDKRGQMTLVMFFVSPSELFFMFQVELLQ